MRNTGKVPVIFILGTFTLFLAEKIQIRLRPQIVDYKGAMSFEVFDMIHLIIPICQYYEVGLRILFE